MEISIKNLNIEEKKILYLFVKPFYSSIGKNGKVLLRDSIRDFKKHYNRLFLHSYSDMNAKENINVKYAEKMNSVKPLVLEFIQTLGLETTDKNYLFQNLIYISKGNIKDLVDFKSFTNSLAVDIDLTNNYRFFEYPSKLNTFSLYILEILIKNFLYEKRKTIFYSQDYLDFFKRAILFFALEEDCSKILLLKKSSVAVPIFKHDYSSLYINKLEEIINVNYN